MQRAHEQGQPLVSPERSDEELALLSQQATGELASALFGELVRRLEGPLFGFLMVRVGNAATAEELVQESFLRAWRKLHLYDPRHRFCTWLYALAKNLAVSRARVQRPSTVPDEILQHVPDGSDPTLRVIENEELEGIWCMARALLNEESCSALWLRYHEGLSNDEIGRILQRPGVTVRVILFRARETLSRALRNVDERESKGLSSALGMGT